MLAGTLALLLVTFLVGGLALLTLAPRLGAFDDQRRRGLLLGGLGIGVLVLGTVTFSAMRREATRRETRAADELLAAIDGLRPGDVLATAQSQAPLPGGATGAAELDGGGVVVYRPVTLAWLAWCVAGRITEDGAVDVRRLHRPCPH